MEEEIVLSPLATAYVDAIYKDLAARSASRRSKNYYSERNRARKELVRMRKLVKSKYNIDVYC
jgi:hypothetical protein